VNVLHENSSPLRRLPYLLVISLLALACAVAALLSRAMVITPDGGATAVWPASGIALAAALVFGARVWPGILLGVMIAAYTSGIPLLGAAAIAVGGTLAALLAAGLVRRWIGLESEFVRGEDVFKFCVVAAACSAVGTSIGLAALTGLGQVDSAQFTAAWWTWWLADVTGVLLVTPPLLVWSGPQRLAHSRTEALELGLFSAMLLFVVHAVFGDTPAREFAGPLLVLLVPFFIWAGFRYSQRAVTAILTGMCGFAIWATMRGNGPFVAGPVDESLLLQTFISIAVVMGLVLSALGIQGRRTTEHLESLVRNRTLELESANRALKADNIMRRQAEERLRRQARARRVMAECNHALVHASDEPRLLAEMCRIAVDSGGYRMAWIGIAAGDGTRSVRTAAHAGAAHGHLEALEAAAEGPLGEVLQSDVACVVRDIAREPQGAPWREEALRRGFGSAMAVPLRNDGVTLGALLLYATEQDAFDADEVALLGGLAADIGYGIASLRTRAAREQADAALRAAEEKLGAIVESIDSVVWSMAADGTLLYLSPAAEAIYQRPRSAFYQDPALWLEVVHPDDRDALQESNARLAEAGAVTREYRVVRPDGSVRWLEDKARVARDEDGRILRTDGIASDITKRKRYESQIVHLATHDALTGLPNRTLLNELLARELAHVQRAQRMMGFLFLDLDRFKLVNDSFGHPLGDQLLQAVATRLQQTVRRCDTVARLGGDEYVVLLSDLQYREDAVVAAHKVLNAFSEPFLIGNTELYASASIGVSVFPDDGEDIDTLLKHADAAMYRAKEHGRNGVELYAREMSAEVQERVALERSLRRALERGELELHYQPQVCLRSGRITGMEALLRWQHPELGLIGPARFIPVAEEIGLIAALGEWALMNACRQCRAWLDQGLGPVRVSVNLSAVQFRQRGVVDAVEHALRHAGLAPQHLELELTESVVMHHAEQAANVVRELKALGLQLAIDDFGTGYSSLSYLKRFPVDRLKIDRSFVRDIINDPDDAAISKAVILLGHSLMLQVVAEGVESAEQLEFLRLHLCDEVQGYLLSAPLPAAAATTLLRTGIELPPLPRARPDLVLRN
jgi:diguanylate cyclase (GGDEF)-like protein/PAS domain S-box-containing protein